MNSYLGAIIAFAGDYEPHDWKFCNGQILSITEFSPLFSLIGTTYGGDGIRNFQLPDLCDRIVVGAGAGNNLTTRAIGQTGGQVTAQLTEVNLPPHVHGLIASATEATSGTPIAGVLATIKDTTSNFYDSVTDAAHPVQLKQFSPKSINSAGGNQVHGNMQPYMAIRYIICVNGLYPSEV